MRTPEAHPTSRIVRDVARFQLKLWLEALRDLVLIPVSLAAAALDLVLSKHQTPRYFREIIAAGRRSDDWIDLWATENPGERAENVDALMVRVERLVRDPKTGSRQARALLRWVEMTLSRQRRSGSGADSQGTDSQDVATRTDGERDAPPPPPTP
jgi:hypothetical protein